MRNAVLIVLLAAVSGNAAAEWVVLGDAGAGNGTSTYYFDPTTIRKTGDRVKMWSLADNKSPAVFAGKSFMSSRFQAEYDCKEEQMRMLYIANSSGNMGLGDIVYSESDAPRWVPVAPGSVNETELKLACGRQ